MVLCYGVRKALENVVFLFFFLIAWEKYSLDYVDEDEDSGKESGI